MYDSANLAAIAPLMTGANMDRADQIRVDPDRLAEVMNWRSRLLKLDALVPGITPEGGLLWNSLGELGEDCEPLFLGMRDDKAHFVELPPRDGTARPVQYDPRLWQAIAHMPRDDLAIYGAARSLVDWHNRHGFCAVCGSPTRISKGGWSRQCDNCGAEHFPRVDPVSIMLAEHDDGVEKRVLLGRQPRFPAKRLSALAGFIEPGESIEEGVARELWEEAGIRVRDVRYVTSQPWPFPSSLMIACICATDDPALTLDTTEIEEAHWFSADDVRAAMANAPDASFIAPPPFAVAHDLLRYWLDTLDEK
ncbi:MAG: NAD(+) diphosphatase [Pseudomonadota bacterium]